MIQEVVLAKANKVDFYCGESMIDLDVLFSAVQLFVRPGPGLSDGLWTFYVVAIKMLKDMIAEKDRGQPVPKSFTMSLVLCYTVWKEATDPKDKIFGLYGIAQHHLSRTTKSRWSRFISKQRDTHWDMIDVWTL